MNILSWRRCAVHKQSIFIIHSWMSHQHPVGFDDKHEKIIEVFFATSRVRPRNCLWFYCILLIETLTSFSRPENLLFFLINGWQIICSKLVLFTVWEEVRRAKIAWEFPDVRIRHISNNWFEKQKFLLNLYRLRGENRND